jgi:hypothetical protein
MSILCTLIINIYHLYFSPPHKENGKGIRISDHRFIRRGPRLIELSFEGTLIFQLHIFPSYKGVVSGQLITIIVTLVT